MAQDRGEHELRAGNLQQAEPLPGEHDQREREPDLQERQRRVLCDCAFDQDERPSQP